MNESIDSVIKLQDLLIQEPIFQKVLREHEPVMLGYPSESASRSSGSFSRRRFFAISASFSGSFSW